MRMTDKMRLNNMYVIWLVNTMLDFIQAAAERSKFVEERRRQRLIEERRKERDERHKERQSERDQIRSKYQLPPRGAANTSSNSSSTKNQASSDEDKKCTIS